MRSERPAAPLPGPRRLLATVGFVLLALIGTSSLSAQQPRILLGRVVHPDGAPLEGVDARVVGSFQDAVSGPDGRFRIVLPDDAARVRFRRIGYRTRTVSLAEGEAGPSDTLRVVLEPHPVELKGLTVEDRPRDETLVLGRTVTTETVRQAPALGEADVFRSLVYLPGVSQPNDLKGRIHLAGGSSDETGYRLDGHPLQEPFHLLGLTGAFNVAALESADVLIHRYPIREGGRLSGLIDLRTRRPADEPASEAVVSVLSSSFTTSRPDLPAGLDLLAAGRITYLDRVAPAFAEDVPQLGFYDGLLRFGKSWSGGWRAELLGFRTHNHFRGGDIKNIEDQRSPLTWGESMAGFRVERERGAWRLSLRGSVNHAATNLDERPVGDDIVDAARDWWSTGLEVTRRSDDWRFTAGASLDHRRHSQSWQARELAGELFSPNTPAVFSGGEELTTMALFGEVSVDLAPRLRATLGSRAVRGGGEWHPAPRALVSYDPSDAVGLEISAGRRLQFDTEIEEPVEGSILPPRFLLDEPRRADVLAAAAEWSPDALPLVATEGRLRLVGFWKRYPDRPLLAEFEAPVLPDRPVPDFPSLRRLEGRSLGASLGLRFRIGEGGLFQGSYTYQRARERVEGEWSPTTWDAPHNLALFTSLPVFGGWSVNAAFRLHSGRAISPVRRRIFVPVRGFGDRFLLPRFFFGDRNSLRLGGYTRLDLGVRHRFDWLGADWVFFAQVLNTLATENPIDIDFRDFLRGRARGLPAGIQNGLPTVPSFGVEMAW